jgi:hypothetical protein
MMGSGYEDEKKHTSGFKKKILRDNPLNNPSIVHHPP